MGRLCDPLTAFLLFSSYIPATWVSYALGGIRVGLSIPSLFLFGWWDQEVLNLLSGGLVWRIGFI